MKKLMFPLLTTFVVLAISVHSSTAQENKERAKAELHVIKTEKIQAKVIKSYQLQKAQEKKKLKARPVREEARLKAIPLELIRKNK